MLFIMLLFSINLLNIIKYLLLIKKKKKKKKENYLNIKIY